ncbi:MAG: hypothetical protein ACKOCT_09830, partial [Alphaproteobacteria bacterium]
DGADSGAIAAWTELPSATTPTPSPTAVPTPDPCAVCTENCVAQYYEEYDHNAEQICYFDGCLASPACGG